MEPVGVGTEMALLSNILAAYAFITGMAHISWGPPSFLQTLPSQLPGAKSASLNCLCISFFAQ